ncbi:MAG: A/G-specific adenine glycosylase [Chloroflexi bacterium]|nr:A/G-specific adenine glycosylase [Chloroflexota bacterium]
MLQQTQVERVIPKYHEFLALFPSFEALASAPVSDVIRAWATLGYNQRAVRLHGIAQQVVGEHGGRLPPDENALLKLKGFGPYTAAALACFAFGRQTAVVDTNVRRVLGRVLLGETGPSPSAMQRLAQDALPAGKASEWAQALMDIGATLCSIRRPRCEACPAQAWCRWANAGLVEGEAQSPVASRLSDQRAVYSVQPPFKGSSRYYRGRIVEALRQAGEEGKLAAEIGSAVRDGFTEADAPWLDGLLAGLERDGLLRRDGLRVRLP